MIEEVRGDYGKMWKVVNEVCNCNLFLEKVQCIIFDGIQYIIFKFIVVVLNSFFVFIGKCLVDKIMIIWLNCNLVLE